MFSYIKRSSDTYETVLLKTLGSFEDDLRKIVFGEYNSFITLKHGFSLLISFPVRLLISPFPSPSSLISPPPIFLLPSNAATVHPFSILLFFFFFLAASAGKEEENVGMCLMSQWFVGERQNI